MGTEKRKIALICLLVFMMAGYVLATNFLRLQMFKVVVDDEIAEKTAMETMQFEEQYLSIEAQAALSRHRIIETDACSSRLAVEQMAAFITDISGRGNGRLKLEDPLSRAALLKDFQGDGDYSLWIFDGQGKMVICLGDSPDSADFGKARYLGLPSKVHGLRDIPVGPGEYPSRGYSKYLGGMNWTLVSFQYQRSFNRKLEAVENLKRQRLDELISDKGIDGSAGVVDENMHFVEYTYANMKGQSVDKLRLEGRFKPSELLFVKEDRSAAFVVSDPVTGSGKYNQGFFHYDDANHLTFFITQDKNRLFRGIDQRISGTFGLYGMAMVIMLLVCGAAGHRRLRNPRRE